MTKFKDHLCRHDSCTLCSAATDLLDAAKWMVEVMREPSESFDDTKDAYHAIERLKQAITKAEGK